MGKSPRLHTNKEDNVKKIQAGDPESMSKDILAQNIEQLRELFPDAWTEEKLEFDILRQLLGGVVDDREERYGLNWPGKRQARRLALTPSIGTLRPSTENSVDWDTTQNLMIEGDNLEVLKLLQKSYAGKVKMIYIDPPYNTGGDLIYMDDFRDNIRNYLTSSNQTEPNGLPLTTNVDSSGRFHTNWLNMMYPRMRLARTLLADDGVIFMSIGDHELHNARMLLTEVFGEENYVNTVCVKAKPSAGASGGGEDKRLKKNAEFLLVFARNRESETALDLNQAFDETELSEHIESMRQENKSWKYTRAITNFGSRSQVATTVDGEGNEIKIFEHTGFSIQTVAELAATGKEIASAYVEHFDVVFRDTNAQSSIRTRVMEAIGNEDGLFSIEYVPRSGRSKGRLTTVYYKGRNKDQVAWLKDIAVKRGDHIFIRGKTGTLWTDFNWNNVSKEANIVFPNGKKPIAFIQRMIAIATKMDKQHLVLDFFAGSGSTGHAVLSANTDGGNRRYILVQLPEPTDIENQSTISGVTIERLRRAAVELQRESPLINSDVGFRVFKLDASNIQTWTPNPENLDETLIESIEHIKIDRCDSDVLYELLLKLGLDLCVPIEEKKIAKKVVQSIGAGSLIVCLASNISREDSEPLALGIIDWNKQQNPAGETSIVFRDSAFADDVAKTNITAILQQHGLENVRSL